MRVLEVAMGNVIPGGKRWLSSDLGWNTNLHLSHPSLRSGKPVHQMITVRASVNGPLDRADNGIAVENMPLHIGRHADA